MFLIGIGNQTKYTAFTLLADKTIGYTLVPISGYSYYTSTTGSSGQGLAVIGYYNSLAYTTDGITWKKVSTGITGATKIIYGNNIWVTFNNYKVYISQNGVDYKESLTMPDYIRDVVFLNNKFYIYVSDKNIYVTIDAKNIITSYSINFDYGILFKSSNTLYIISNGGRYLIWNDNYRNTGYLVDIDPSLPSSDYNAVRNISLANDKIFVTYSSSYGGDNKTFVIDASTSSAYASTAPQLPLNNFIFSYGTYYAITAGGIVISSTDPTGTWNQENLKTSLTNYKNSGLFNELNVAQIDGFSNIVFDNQGAIATVDNTGNIYIKNTFSTQWSIFAANKPQYAGYFLGYANPYFIYMDDHNNFYYINSSSLNADNGPVFYPNSVGVMDSFAEAGSYRIYNKITLFNNKYILTNTTGGVAYWEPLSPHLAKSGTTLGSGQYWSLPIEGKITTLVQVQVAIGGQGDGSGGQAETLAPVKVYTVPTGKIATISQIKVINLHSASITYDLGKLSLGQKLNQANSIKWDTALAGNATDILNQTINMVAGDSITVLPSTVNTVDVKVYGIESNA